MFMIVYFSVILVLSVFRYILKLDSDLVNMIGFAIVIATQFQMASDKK